jgi:hypothetical protein
LRVHIEHETGVRQHRDVAAGDLDDGGLRYETLLLGMDGTVLGGEDKPTRLRLPRGALNLLIEKGPPPAQRALPT